MKPIDVMRFRELNRGASQSLNWGGYDTVSFGSGTFVLQFNNDGTVNLPGGSSGNWLAVTPDATSAALYEIRWTSASGLLTESTALTVDVWYPLSVSRSFTINGTQGPSDKSSAFVIAIRLASSSGDGTSAVWQHTITGNG